MKSIFDFVSRPKFLLAVEIGVARVIKSYIKLEYRNCEYLNYHYVAHNVLQRLHRSRVIERLFSSVLYNVL